MASIEVGDPAPDFSAVASDGQRISLADFKGRKSVVIFFYPRDNTPVCTTEACAFRDSYESFTELGAEVIGISSDSDESHRSFAAGHHLPFHLISDASGALRRLFAVPNSLFVLPGRVTYVIDRDGIVRHKFNSQLQGAKHVQEAIEVIRRLQQGAAS